MKVLLLGLCVFFGGASAFADDDDDIIPKKKAVEEDTGLTSEQNRANNQFTATFQFFGTGPNKTMNRAIAVGYFLNPNMALIIEGTRGNEYSLDIFDDTDVDGRSLGIHLKHFVGNSFYYRAGIDYRVVKYQYTDEFLISEYRRFEAKSWGVTVNIGNQWQWEHFTLGCDWVGVTLPVSKTYSDEIVATTGNLATAQQNFEDDRDELIEKPSLNLLRFYIGASF